MSLNQPISLPVFKLYCEDQFEQITQKLEGQDKRFDNIAKLLGLLISRFNEVDGRQGLEEKDNSIEIIPGSHDVVIGEIARKASQTASKLVSENEMLNEIR